MHTASFLPQTYAALPEVGSTIAGLAPAHCMRTHSHRRKLMDAVRRGLLVFLLALWIVPQGASAKEQQNLIIDNPRQSKVSDLNLPVLVYQKIGRF